MSTPRSPLTRWALMVTTTLGFAVTIGLLGLLTQAGPPLLIFTIFAVCGLAPGAGVGLLVSATPPTEDHLEDSVERTWFSKAVAGAATDTTTAAGIALFGLSLTSLDVSGRAVLCGVIVVMFAATGIRYWVLSRREG